ncbi:hypothetical protein GCM10011344_36010 [Dokdonia pacifica]|uniref:Bacteriocin-type signal sequence-containing protein n=1 Tax=Dokdonia pacifica TaxID=1627892 RepID=A0A239AUH5_9FLAO|nr:hypothetical protein [Dokdonia pacifica]GGG31875.1 hypothetical protein GCM10011344_36010 [Dokdonia pacifica]SNR99355.1 hypothetical protein SAMN06265376_105148 [Dokdonia pacifica]
MLKNILKLKGIKKLNTSEQRDVSGGFRANCPTYPASECIACGGGPLANGCCKGSYETHQCLIFGGGIGD